MRGTGRSSLLAATLLAAGCAPATDPAPRATAVDLPPAPTAAPHARDRGSPAVVADGDPLRDGVQTFVGMVRPTKAGLDVRGVVFDDDTLPRALGQAGSETLLGALVEVTADLARHDVPPQPPGEPAIQRRSGTWHGVRRIDRARIVAAPVMIEGVVGRSKGLVSVGEHLIRRDDLGWSLAPAGGWTEGDRVRLWGQPRVVRCGPHEQCLLGGEIPMFDVGRAEKLAP